MRSNAVECHIFAQATPKIFTLCLFIRCRAATNGANPAKFTQPRPRQNAKAEPSMHPDTKEIPRKAKRNRELADLPEIPYLCCVFLPTYRLHGILTAPPGFVRAGFLLPSTVVRIPRPHPGGHFRPILAHIIVHIQFAVKARFRLVFGHCIKAQFDARHV